MAAFGKRSQAPGFGTWLAIFWAPLLVAFGLTPWFSGPRRFFVVGCGVLTTFLAAFGGGSDRLCEAAALVSGCLAASAVLFAWPFGQTAIAIVWAAGMFFLLTGPFSHKLRSRNGHDVPTVS
jgi:hypothetical protein